MSTTDYQPDDFIGEYILREKLGSGGFGEVWKAQKQGGENFIALKILKENANISALEKERDSLHSLEHPNIVKIVTDNLAHEPPYIIMEYVEGESLDRKLKGGEKLKVRDALKIYRKIIAGIEFAHSKGIIHRDLKPGNVLISNNGEVKVCDFGHGRSIEKDSLSVSLVTKGEGIVGTFEYMAPEQLSGEAADKGSDVYSLGRLLFRMLAGCVPEGIDEYLVKTVRGAKATSLDAIFRRCCAGRDRRYPDAKALLEDIDRVRKRKKLSPETLAILAKSADVTGFEPFALGRMLLKAHTIEYSKKKGAITKIELEDINTISWSRRKNHTLAIIRSVPAAAVAMIVTVFAGVLAQEDVYGSGVNMGVFIVGGVLSAFIFVILYIYNMSYDVHVYMITKYGKLRCRLEDEDADKIGHFLFLVKKRAAEMGNEIEITQK
ncbi:MAG: serine/threonine protein kinase [Planctomycetota bacterium]